MGPNEVIEACARAAHEVNRAYCLALGDSSQPPWESAPDWHRSSIRAGVKGALDGNTPEQSHECWIDEKRRSGWKLGPVKDPEHKTHPCMVAYNELPPEQRQKDTLFISTVKIMVLALNQTVS